MENLENEEPEKDLLLFDDEANVYLLETAKWGKFLAIVGYVFMGILVLFGILMIFGISRINTLGGVRFPFGFMSVIFLLTFVLYYFPITYLYRFSVKIKKGILSKNGSDVTAGFSNLKSMFKFMGIFTIVILSFYVIGLLMAIPTMMFFLR